MSVRQGTEVVVEEHNDQLRKVRYHEPGTPDYNSPLFLDCCGLIRRVLQDLHKEFGFKIGRWNQAYQFDTLPVSLDPSEARPGDLVFTQGIYYSENKKQQKHEMVHVEIFLGTGESGEETLGARYQKGYIQILPSYKFTSKNYEIKAYHFRSLDTWLDGVCESRCEEHPWIETNPQQAAGFNPAGKRSIFSSEANFDDEDVNADEGDVDDAEVEKQSSSKVFYVGKGNGWKLVAQALERRGWRRLPFSYAFRSAYDLKWGHLRSEIDYLAHRPGQLVNHIPNNTVITSKVGLLETLRAAAAAAAACGGGGGGGGGGGFLLPAYFPETYRMDVPSEALQLLRIQKEAEEAGQPIVWIVKPAHGNCGRGVEIVDSSEKLHAMCFPEVADRADVAGTPATWLKRRSSSNHEEPTAGRGALARAVAEEGASPPLLEEERPQAAVVPPPAGDKDLARRGAQEQGADNTAPAPAGGPPAAGAAPNLPAAPLRPIVGGEGPAAAGAPPASPVKGPARGEGETGAPVAAAAAAGNDAEDGAAPAADAPPLPARKKGLPVSAVQAKERCGVGVYDVRSISNASGPGPVKKHQPSLEPAIAQRYMTNPLLVDGKKFDIRTYMLVARTSPYLVYFHNGYARLSFEDYPPDDLGNRLAHLTNAAVQYTHPDYKARAGTNIWSMGQLKQYFVDKGTHTERFFDEELPAQMKSIMVSVCEAARNRLERKAGFFDLLGCDFLLLEGTGGAGAPRPPLRLLEVNTNPALHTNAPVLAELLPPMVDEALHLVIQASSIFKEEKEKEGLSPSSDEEEGVIEVTNNFELIVDEQAGFLYRYSPADIPDLQQSPL